MTFKHWFYHLFNPHCAECNLQRDQEIMLETRRDSCKGCEILQEQLNYMRADRDRLVDALLHRPVGQEIQLPVAHQPNPVPVGSPNIPWPQMRRQLELRDRLEFEKLKKAKEQEKDPAVRKDIEDLEKELGVENA